MRTICIDFFLHRNEDCQMLNAIALYLLSPAKTLLKNSLHCCLLWRCLVFSVEVPRDFVLVPSRSSFTILFI
ncbi:hypothetical protein CUMW_144510 [Citrus unshiu]|uniref:Uncharacterized protein n=1 Tax=Citrus sinensis TaxID=2711 RepID=A0A067G2V2_CITSI|nr:hypothetical protein CISIN_1g046625mg [Citrus sinensis]GAY52771.1 hypothetical protein CUMW_144510 [Citrus unshiu]